MIDLSTNYMGLRLANPLVVSASPLCEDTNNIRRMEDAGASAVVLHSLFEEQIVREEHRLDKYLSFGIDSYAESVSYFPDMQKYNLGPDGYLEHIRKAKEAVRIPIIGSLNGVTLGGWIRYAKKIEQAGADGLELNIYDIATNPDVSGAELEHNYTELVAALRESIRIPLAVKLHPFFTSISSIARDLERAGANALVLFNRFYQPDFDLENLEVVPNLVLSTPQELLLRLHWVAILYGNVKLDLAVTGGVHSAQDILKVMMAGGHVAMTTSALFKFGISYLQNMLTELIEWMDEHEYDSIRQMQGSMSRVSAGDPAAFERANYMKVLGSHRVR